MKLDERLLSVDILRIASICIVIFSHYSFYPRADIGGTTGVVLFFMISGFCMAYSTEGRTGSGFILARVKRLAPEFFVCVTITALIEGAWPDIRPDRAQMARDYLFNVVCLPTGNIFCDAVMQVRTGAPVNYVLVDGAYWSLLVEFRYYILLWFLAYVVRVPRPAIVMAVLAVASGFSADLPFASKANDFAQYLSFFAFGMAVRDLRDGNRCGYLIGVLAIASFVFNSMMGTKAYSMPLGDGVLLRYAACFVVFPSIIWLAGQRKSGKICATLGLISYPLYLLHQDVGFIMIDCLSVSMSSVEAKIFTVVVMIVAAYFIQLASRSTVRWINARLRSGRLLGSLR